MRPRPAAAEAVSEGIVPKTEPEADWTFGRYKLLYELFFPTTKETGLSMAGWLSLKVYGF
jgi:hypothetical protein